MRALPSLAFAAILACAALPARADYMIGFEAFRIEEYGVAHSELLPAAEAGDGVGTHLDHALAVLLLL